jgi:hypothetical protein
MKTRHSWITALAAAPVLALPLGPAAAAPATAASPASGRVTCPIAAGTGTLSPGLTSAGSLGGIKISFNGKLAGNCASAVTQPQGDQVTGGTFTGGGFYTGATASSCANFDGVDVVGQITVVITWKTTGAPIARTTIVYKSNPGTVSGSETIALNAPPGTATKAGSFSAGTLHLTQLKTNLPGPVCPPGPPITTFTITGGEVKV